MDYRNAAYNQFGTVDVEINHPDFGWIPFTASPDDPEPFGRAIYDEVKGTSIAPYVSPTPARQQVLKSAVMDRLTSAQMASAYALLIANPVNFGKWFAPDKPYVNCDDPNAIAVVKALGLDPAVILAP